MRWPLLFLVGFLWPCAVLAQTNEQASKITGLTVLQGLDQRESKVTGFVVLQGSIEMASKVVGFVVLSGTASAATNPATSGLSLGIQRW